MKYRIKETDYKFYPQRKIFIFWIYFDGESYRYWDEFFGVLDIKIYISIH